MWAQTAEQTRGQCGDRREQDWGRVRATQRSVSWRLQPRFLSCLVLALPRNGGRSEGPQPRGMGTPLPPCVSEAVELGVPPMKPELGVHVCGLSADRLCPNPRPALGMGGSELGWSPDGACPTCRGGSPRTPPSSLPRKSLLFLRRACCCCVRTPGEAPLLTPVLGGPPWLSPEVADRAAWTQAAVLLLLLCVGAGLSLGFAVLLGFRQPLRRECRGSGSSCSLLGAAGPSPARRRL